MKKKRRGGGEPETAEHRGQLKNPDRRGAAALLVHRQIDVAAPFRAEDVGMLAEGLDLVAGDAQDAEQVTIAAGSLRDIARMLRAAEYREPKRLRCINCRELVTPTTEGLCPNCSACLPR